VQDVFANIAVLCDCTLQTMRYRN